MVESADPSNEELQALSDIQFLSLKDSVSKKIIATLSGIERELHNQIQSSSFQFPNSAFLRSGKISKGENYRGLPYFVLDYPRLFTQTEVFAFRTMLWWGHEFSCTLHLGGNQLKRISPKILHDISLDTDIFFCIQDNPWEYHFEKDNYLKSNELSADQMQSYISKNNFIKISRCISINEWGKFKSHTLETFARFLKLLD
ncbi:MAG: hypothetical protein ABJG41_11555 [Cyclobacteriaceae bacterium]